MHLHAPEGEKGSFVRFLSGRDGLCPASVRERGEKFRVNQGHYGLGGRIGGTVVRFRSGVAQNAVDRLPFFDRQFARENGERLEILERGILRPFHRRLCIHAVDIGPRDLARSEPVGQSGTVLGDVCGDSVHS